MPAILYISHNSRARVEVRVPTNFDLTYGGAARVIWSLIRSDSQAISWEIKVTAIFSGLLIGSTLVAFDCARTLVATSCAGVEDFG